MLSTASGAPSPGAASLITAVANPLPPKPWPLSHLPTSPPPQLPTSPSSHLQGLVPAVWTEARGAGSPALCAGSPGPSSLPSEPHIGSSTLHISARPEPGTAEGEQGRGWYLGSWEFVQLTASTALGPQLQSLCSASYLCALQLLLCAHFLLQHFLQGLFGFLLIAVFLVFHLHQHLLHPPRGIFLQI